MKAASKSSKALSALMALVLTTSLSNGSSLNERNRKRPPNVLILIVDDAGTQDLGFSSRLQLDMFKDNENVDPFDLSPIQTPFLDSLAEESILFPQYYTHPSCTPSRSALMTGKYAFKNGLPFPILGPGAMVGLDPSLKTVANYYQEAGYATHMVGKWHLGHAKDIYRPPRRGFNTFLGCIGAGFDHYTKSIPGCIDLWNTTEPNTSTTLLQFTHEEIDTTQHATELFSDEAVRLIKDHDTSKPFFMYLSYTSLHAPVQADEQYINSPECRDIPNDTRRTFCGMALQLDQGIKRVIDAMKHKDMWDDTYMVFTTDNGGMPIVGGFNYPFRGHKAESWDGGVRGPAFFRSPPARGLPMKGVYHGLIHIADWLPTLNKATGLNTDLGNIDGIDHFDAFQTMVSDRSSIRNSVAVLPDLSTFPRTTVIPQADIFLNTTSVREGCHKLILGPPGYNHVYQEPDKLLMTNVSWAHTILEPFLQLAETRFVPGWMRQFFKYGVVNIIEQTQAILGGNRYIMDQRTFMRSHSETTVTGSYQKDPITIQWDAQPGPVVFLFDVCDDPSESKNLATDEKEKVERLYQMLAGEAGRAPVQFAGDITLFDATPDMACVPFLEDDTQLLSTVVGEETSLHPEFIKNHGKAGRYFVYMIKQAQQSIACLVIAIMTLFFWSRGSFSKLVQQKGKREGFFN